MNAVEVREEVLSWMKNAPDGKDKSTSSGERGVMIGLINSVLRMDGKYSEADNRRKQVIGWLFRDVLNKPYASGISTKELTDEMWWALIRWAEPHKDQDTGVWVGRNGFNDAVYACWRAMEDWEMETYGQLGFPADML